MERLKLLRLNYLKTMKRLVSSQRSSWSPKEVQANEIGTIKKRKHSTDSDDFLEIKRHKHVEQNLASTQNEPPNPVDSKIIPEIKCKCDLVLENLKNSRIDCLLSLCIVSDMEKSMSVENRDDDPGCARARARVLKFSENCKCKFSIAYDCLKLYWSIFFSLKISNSSKSSWMCAPRKKNVRKS